MGTALVPGIHLLSAVQDTIYSTKEMVVQVVDAEGHARPGIAVRFETLPDTAALFRGFRGAPIDTRSGLPARWVTDTTDRNGRAAVSLAFEGIAGVGSVLVASAELGYADTLQYTVMPGAAADLVIEPTDTAVYADRAFTLRAAVRDRAGNPRTDGGIAFSTVSGPVSVNGSTGGGTGTAIGRGAVVASWKGHEDTARISVVPHGVVATLKYDPQNGGPVGIFLSELDGSEQRRIAPGTDNLYTRQGLAWSADGRQLVFARANRLQILVPGEPERTVAQLSGWTVGEPRVTRDGAWIYFAHSGSSAQPKGIYRVRMDGSELTPVASYWPEYMPSPSPDGRYLAFVSERTPCGMASCVRILDVAAGHDTDFFIYGTHVAWSPVANRVAVGSDTRVVIAAPDGSIERVLMEGSFRMHWMEWSPDGRWLIVSDEHLTLIDTQTGMLLPLPSALAFGPTAWRP
ncbi:MAG TPA: hypothetical protein VFH27_01040 [Longimicrobiaceae bacterium]|nr:hypothetical protein [Longimicrobiaceae bacterium]